MATGTAANALALSALVRPWSAVLCDKAAHIDNDEGGAPEFYMGGGKILSLPSRDGKITPEKLEKAFRKNRAKGVLASPIQALSLSQATEFGTIYAGDELKIRICLIY